MCLGVPGRLTAIYREGDLPMGTVDFGGVKRAVCLAYVEDEVAVGDYVVVHVGFAISRVNEAEASQAFRALEALGEQP